MGPFVEKDNSEMEKWPPKCPKMVDMGWDHVSITFPAMRKARMKPVAILDDGRFAQTLSAAEKILSTGATVLLYSFNRME